MDVNQGEIGKYAGIRQTIRQVILPVVQAIYDDNPPDVVQFCSRYFNDLVRKREFGGKLTEGRNANYPEAFKNEEDKRKEKTNENKSPSGLSSSNIQGSASEPLLASEKLNLGLRETSSWNIPPTHSQTDGSETQNFDPRDVMCKIGDQPDSLVTKTTEKEEIDEKAEVAGFSIEKEEKLFQTNDISEHEISPVIKTNSTTEEAKALPTASLDAEKDKKEKETDFINSEVCDENSVGKQVMDAPKFQNEEYKEYSQFLSNVLSTQSSGEHFVIDGNIEGRCNKQISPNSSFGFIPQLKEDDSTEEEKNTNVDPPKDSYFHKQLTENAQELAGKFSETFRDLAHKFNSAETKLNDEFQKVKEISDIIQGPLQNDVATDDGKQANKDSESMSSEETDNFYVSDENKNDEENSFEERREYFNDQNLEENNKETNNEFSNAYSLLKENINKYGGFRSNLEYDELSLAESDAIKDRSLCQNDQNENESRKSGFNSRTTVDESWRKRWYKAHPCLDSIRRNVQKMTPRLFQPQRDMIGNRGIPMVHGIGEAGDVPPGTGYIFESNLSRTPACSELNNKRENIDNNSAVKKELPFQSNLLTNENCKGMNSEKSSRNNDSPSSKASNISSQNVPYSWRKMSKQQASYLETEKHVLKQIATTLSEGAISPKKTEGLKAGIQDEHGTLPEISELSENDLSVKNNSPKSQCISPRDGNNGKLDKFKQLENFPRKTSEGGDAAFENREKLYKENINDTTLSSLDTKDKSLTNEDTFIEGCNNSSENEQKSYQEKMTDSNYKNISKLEQKGDETYHSVDEGNKELKNLPQTTGSREGSETKKFDTKELQSEIKDSIQRFNESLKIEPGLNAACGDFTLPVISEHGQDFNMRQGSRIDGENGPASFHNAEQPADAGVQPITSEYVEGIIERVIQDQSLTSDSYEGLNFSSYSESESSNIESDFSEADDINLSPETQDF